MFVTWSHAAVLFLSHYKPRYLFISHADDMWAFPSENWVEIRSVVTFRRVEWVVFPQRAVWSSSSQETRGSSVRSWLTAAPGFNMAKWPATSCQQASLTLVAPSLFLFSELVIRDKRFQPSYDHNKVDLQQHFYISTLLCVRLSTIIFIQSPLPKKYP